MTIKGLTFRRHKVEGLAQLYLGAGNKTPIDLRQGVEVSTCYKANKGRRGGGQGSTRANKRFLRKGFGGTVHKHMWQLVGESEVNPTRDMGTWLEG